ncbi:type II toxin-antitoxin system ParD family antitoxin [Beijerinckia sp. L45]|uniref:type II toxin-antitoxin system ParD family antitoxin n=1 Tax=Beijerinckia sp. L45 TaxID=1641855 RepID=UPI00131C0FAE|nr:type II toxin-antitoxin system ParD family antitoxin [Beijerinckia sp. L45]
MSGDADLGQHLEHFVSALVRDGRYESRNDVLREGIRLIEQRENRLASLNAALARGNADADAGRVKPAREVADRLTAKYQRMAKDRDD